MESVKNTPCIYLEPYLDGELDNVTGATFEFHLSTCEPCRKTIEDWRTISHEYTRWTDTQQHYPSETPAADEVAVFLQRIETRLPKTSSPLQPTKNTPPKRVLFAIAAALLIGVTSFWAWQNYSHRISQATPVSTPTSSGPIATAPPHTTPATARILRLTNGVQHTSNLPLETQQVLNTDAAEHIIANIEGDTIGVDSQSSLVIRSIETNLSSFELRKGLAAFQVSPRSEGAAFTVAVKSTTITVVGTRFSVALMPNDDIVVSVGEGVVRVGRVGRDSDRTELHAGARLVVSSDMPLAPTDAEPIHLQAIDDLLQVNSGHIHAEQNPPITTPMVSAKERPSPGTFIPNPKKIGEWRQMIINGEHASVETQIQHYLKRHPGDVDARMLLATCQKKSGQHAAAYQTYQEVIRVAGSSVANRARYSAGELAQNELNAPEHAVRMFETYLQNTPGDSPNRAEAKFRLAGALLRTGDRRRAKVLLNEIVDEYGRTPVANRARTLLEAQP